MGRPRRPAPPPPCCLTEAAAVGRLERAGALVEPQERRQRGVAWGGAVIRQLVARTPDRVIRGLIRVTPTTHGPVAEESTVEMVCAAVRRALAAP